MTDGIDADYIKRWRQTWKKEKPPAGFKLLALRKAFLATKWLKNGDHPADACETFKDSEGKDFQGEGKVVRYYRHPGVDGTSVCEKCGQTMHQHGWIDSLDATVCPGDWILTTGNDLDDKITRFVCDPASFVLRYQEEAGEKKTEVPIGDRFRELQFCVCCFATDEGGSWGEGVVSGHCMNCGAGGSTVRLPRWAVDSIREQASWVGKRYYPHEEDGVLGKEIRALRSAIGKYPGRTVTRVSRDDEDSWEIVQRVVSGSIMTVVSVKEGETEEQALARTAHLLPVVLDLLTAEEKD